MSEPKTLLEYVPELLEEMDRVKAEEDAAQAEDARIKATIAETELVLDRRERELVKPDRSAVLADAALRGVPPPPEPEDVPGPSLEDLRATIKGLQAKRAEPLARIENARADLHARTIHVFREAAERAAAEYVEHAKRLEALHAEIGAAQRLAEMLGPDATRHTVVGLDWWELHVPASDQLEAMRGALRTAHFRQVLAGGDRGADAHRASFAAFQRAQAEMVQRFGRWPLEKVR